MKTQINIIDQNIKDALVKVILVPENKADIDLIRLASDPDCVLDDKQKGILESSITQAVRPFRPLEMGSIDETGIVVVKCTKI